MYIIKNQSNTIVLTLNEKEVNTLHDWLFEFTNEMTGEVKYCHSADISNYITRYNEFIIIDSATENAYNGTLNFTPTGSWSYKVYEMPVASPPSLTPTGYYGIAEQSSLLVYNTLEDVNVNFNAEENKDNGVFDA